MPDAGPPLTGGEISLPPLATSVREARRFVQQHLGRLPTEVLENITLLVSELATNAVLHARTPFRVVVGRRGQRIRVAVDDGNPTPPVVKDYGLEAVTGRGMQLVAALSNDWGTDPSADGKSVWFEVTAGADALIRGQR